MQKWTGGDKRILEGSLYQSHCNERMKLLVAWLCFMSPTQVRMQEERELLTGWMAESQCRRTNKAWWGKLRKSHPLLYCHPLVFFSPILYQGYDYALHCYRLGENCPSNNPAAKDQGWRWVPRWMWVSSHSLCKQDKLLAELHVKEHGQKVEGSYIHRAEFWESCTWNSSSSFEAPVQKGCTEAGERPVKATNIIKAGACDLSGEVEGAGLIL